nr:unnamed protein product [Digitaria exilis]
MDYHRKPQPHPPPSFEHHHPPSVGPASPDSLAAQAMRASAAHRDASSIASAYSSSASAATRRGHHEPSVSAPSPDSSGYEYTSMKSLNEAKYGFWGALARKAKSLLDEDGSPGQHESPTGQQSPRDGASASVQEGRTIVENKTADILQETRKLNIRRKGAVSSTQGEAGHKLAQRYLPQNPLDHETQLKASRDVRYN